MVESKDYIGWKSENGNLEILNIFKDAKGYYKAVVKCSVCAKDDLLFPEGIFTSHLHDILRGVCPCGCSKNPNYTEEQRLYKVNKLLKEYNSESYIISKDRYIGKSTYFTWYCGACGKEHNTTYHNFINKGSRCQIFDMNRVTYVYLSDWIDYENIKPFIKVGITHNIKNRIKEQQSVTKSLFKNIEYFKFNTFREALYVESLLLKTFPRGYVSKQEF